MTAARIPYSAAREGQMPVFLSMIHIDFLTPAPAVMLNGILASLLLLSGDINSLINYFSFCMWIFHTSVSSFLGKRVNLLFSDLFRHFHLSKNASDGHSRAFIRRSSLHSRCYNSDWFLSCPCAVYQHLPNGRKPRSWLFVCRLLDCARCWIVSRPSKIEEFEDHPTPHEENADFVKSCFA